MTFKSRIKFYFIVLMCAFLWNQQASFLTQKNALEVSYRDKVVSAISLLLGQKNFIVIVNVEFSTSSETIKKLGGTSSLEGYTPIPGLPTVPSRDSSMPNYIQGSRQLSEYKFPISRVKVNIELDEKLAANPSIKQEIKSLIKKVVPETKECDDCIKIEYIENLGSIQADDSKEIDKLQLKKTTKIDELIKEIEALKSAQRHAEEEKLTTELEDMENRLKEAKNARANSDEKINVWEKELKRRDDLEYERLVEFEKSRRNEENIRNDNIESELKKAREDMEKRRNELEDNRMRTDSSHLSTALSIVDKQVGGDENENEKSILGMQIGNGGSGLMGSFVIILLIICLMIVTVLAANNKKPKPIYLKPKIKKGSTETTNISEINNDQEDSTSSNLQTPSTQERNEDAIRSELRTLRQTAVSLSVGEKESASALIKEWLEDNPNKGENPVN